MNVNAWQQFAPLSAEANRKIEFGNKINEYKGHWKWKEKKGSLKKKTHGRQKEEK